jgi:hypothetical protein
MPTSAGREQQLAADLPAGCPNCGQDLGQPRPRFCPACGQETHVLPPRLGEFLQQFGGAYFSTEGALWRTLKLLLLQPGELTRQYLAGRRKHYVLPLRLYLSISLVVLLLVRLTDAVTPVGGLDNPGLAASVHQAQPKVQLNLWVAHAGIRDGSFHCDGLPAWACQRLRQRFEGDPQGLLQRLQRINEGLVSHLGTAMFVLLPGFALGLRLLYANRGLRFGAHLVHALHLHSFWFIVLACMLVQQPLVTGLGVATMALYAGLAGKRVYGGRWWPRLLRALVLTLVYASVVAASVPLAVLAGLLA